MHELGIAQDIFDIVRQYVPSSRAPGVRAVRLQVGEMAGVVVDSLDFCFGAIVAGTPYEMAFLTIEQIPVTARCDACGHIFVAGAPFFVCPACASTAVTMTSGAELHVVDVEIDEGPPEPP